MIVPASGHQVRCIPWVQMGTFNKEIGFLCGLKFLHWIYFVGNTYNRVYIWWRASKHRGLLNSCLGKWHLLPYLVVPLISTRVSLISTRVSAHCQAILLCQKWKKSKKFKSYRADKSLRSAVAAARAAAHEPVQKHKVTPVYRGDLIKIR